jgi:hypothetical protein
MRKPHDRVALGVAAVALALIGPARAGEPEPEPIATDRPDFTETAIVVPRGRLQLETGFTYENGSSGHRSFNLPEALLRWGIAEKTELRFVLPDYIRAWNGDKTSGIGDSAIGFKHQLGPVGRFDLAVIGHATIPTGSSAFSSDRVDPEAAFTWATDLDERTSIAGMFGFLWPSEDGERNFTFTPTVSLGRSLGGRWGAFLEWAAEFPEDGGDIHLLHHGYTYRLSNDSQLDMHVGFGLSQAAPDFFIGGGYSVRF